MVVLLPLQLLRPARIGWHKWYDFHNYVFIISGSLSHIARFVVCFICSNVAVNSVAVVSCIVPFVFLLMVASCCFHWPTDQCQPTTSASPSSSSPPLQPVFLLFVVEQGPHTTGRGRRSTCLTGCQRTRHNFCEHRIQHECNKQGETEVHKYQGPVCLRISFETQDNCDDQCHNE